jgi:cGMP-dependent protein kinase
MEYFEFAPQECVVKQGDVGTTFFVTHDGEMEVSVNGKIVNTMDRGRAFGGLALLYNCPRTASVTSKSKSSAWGANGGTFHKVLQDNAKKSYSENRQFLDSIRLFDGLAVKQKDRVGEAFFVEAFEPGQRVVTEGEAATAMYFVKKGELRIVREAKIDAAGKIVSCSEIARINRGECFGERALLYNEARASTVVADSRCELLCISGDQLREVLGHDLRACLEQNIIIVALQKSPVISQFSVTQQMSISKVVLVKDFKAGEAVPKGLRFAVICDGEVKGKNNGKEVKLGRAMWFEQDTLLEDVGDDKTPSKQRKTVKEEQALAALDHSKGTLKDLVAGQGGARVAILTEDALAKVAKELGLSGFDNSDYARKMILVRKVHIFRHLAQEALEKIVKSFAVEKFKKDQAVIKQGEPGTKFFVIATGEVGVSISGKFIRTMPRNQFFGERALLFDENRTATITVSTSEAEMWSMSNFQCGTLQFPLVSERLSFTAADRSVRE